MQSTPHSCVNRKNFISRVLNFSKLLRIFSEILQAWNSLGDDLRDPTLSTDSFRRLLNLILGYFQSTSTYSVLKVLYAPYKFMTYLLT